MACLVVKVFRCCFRGWKVELQDVWPILIGKARMFGILWRFSHQMGAAFKKWCKKMTMNDLILFFLRLTRALFPTGLLQEEQKRQKILLWLIQLLSVWGESLILIDLERKWRALEWGAILQAPMSHCCSTQGFTALHKNIHMVEYVICYIVGKIILCVCFV
jgi:hypothetical protein